MSDRRLRSDREGCCIPFYIHWGTTRSFCSRNWHDLCQDFEPQATTKKKKTWVLEWVWADCACGRNMKNCIQEGWLQQIYFINGFNLFQARPHSSPLSGPTPYSPWHFGVLPLWAGLLPAEFGHMIYWHIVTSGCFYNKVSTPVASFLLYTQAVLGYQSMVSCPSFSGLQRERKTLWTISNEGCREKIDTSIPILHQQWLSLVLLFNSLRANIFCYHKKKKSDFRLKIT